MDRSIEDPGVFLRTNILGTQALMDACRELRHPAFPPGGELMRSTETCRWTGRTCSSQRRPAAAGVQPVFRFQGMLQTCCAMAYHRTYGLPVTISRCSNNYGPYQFPEKLIPLMIANALADKPLPVYGTGENVRDWLYVEDHCKAIDLILHNGQCGRSLQHRRTQRDAPIMDVVKTDSAKQLGKPESLITLCGRPKGSRSSLCHRSV